MSAQNKPGQLLDHPHRRSFLQASSAITAMAFLGTGTLSSIAYADALTEAQRDKLTPDDILALMKKGNKRFYTGKRKERNLLAQQRASAKGQHPAAILLTCVDSRAPAETIMDLGIGDIFNSRVAGNVESPDILGSMEFACKLSGSKVVLVMGHTGCGAIKGAIDNAELGNLTGLLAKIKPAVAATTYAGERTSKNYAFVDAVRAQECGDDDEQHSQGQSRARRNGVAGRDQDRRCDVQPGDGCSGLLRRMIQCATRVFSWCRTRVCNGSNSVLERNMFQVDRTLFVRSNPD